MPNDDGAPCSIMCMMIAIRLMPMKVVVPYTTMPAAMLMILLWWNVLVLLIAYIFIVHIYYRVDRVVRLQKSRSDPDQVQHPGPWTAAEDQDQAQEKSRILHRIPRLVAPGSHGSGQAKTRNQGQTPGKSTGTREKS